MRFMLVVMGLLLTGVMSTRSSLDSCGEGEREILTGEREGKENWGRLKIAAMIRDGKMKNVSGRCQRLKQIS